MIKNKNKRVILTIVFWGILASLPLYAEIYYISLYYIMVILMGILLTVQEKLLQNGKMEEKFFEKWSQSRKKGALFHCIRAGARSFIVMTLVVSAGQLFGNGITPAEVINVLPRGLIINLFILLVVFSLIIGIVSWFENEKRYGKIYGNKI